MASVRPTTQAKSLLRLTRALVRLPSRAGLDDYRPVAAAITTWLDKHGVAHRVLRGARGRLLGIEGRIGDPTAPAWLLNATADTAPFGDPSGWTHPPTAAVLDDGWLWGRGAADSKSGVALFCHVLAALARQRRPPRRPVAFLFDFDEHGGAFGGVRRWLDAQRAAGRTYAGAYIGYPGHERVVIGCRGFLRATLTVHGSAAHSGSSRARGVNAIGRAARLVAALDAARLPGRERGFGPGPRLTVTGVRGGAGDSVVPERCELDLDVRLTPAFGEEQASALLGARLAALDRGAGALAASTLTVRACCPPYRIDARAPLVAALREAARGALGRDLEPVVAGPSSAGNLLAGAGIPATSGFGAAARNLHAADEAIEVATLEPAFATYLGALRMLTA